MFWWVSATDAEIVIGAVTSGIVAVSGLILAVSNAFKTRAQQHRLDRQGQALSSQREVIEQHQVTLSELQEGKEASDG